MRDVPVIVNRSQYNYALAHSDLFLALIKLLACIECLVPVRTLSVAFPSLSPG